MMLSFTGKKSRSKKFSSVSAKYNILPFSIPPRHDVPAEELLRVLASEWAPIAGDGGSVTLERAESVRA